MYAFLFMESTGINVYFVNRDLHQLSPATSCPSHQPPRCYVLHECNNNSTFQAFSVGGLCVCAIKPMNNQKLGTNIRDHDPEAGIRNRFQEFIHGQQRIRNHK
jgi:hypothetical protein